MRPRLAHLEIRYEVCHEAWRVLCEPTLCPPSQGQLDLENLSANLSLVEFECALLG